MSLKIRMTEDRIQTFESNINQLEVRLGRLTDMATDRNRVAVEKEIWAIKENIRDNQEKLKEEFELKDQLEAEIVK